MNVKEMVLSALINAAMCGLVAVIMWSVNKTYEIETKFVSKSIADVTLLDGLMKQMDRRIEDLQEEVDELKHNLKSFEGKKVPKPKKTPKAPVKKLSAPVVKKKENVKFHKYFTEQRQLHQIIK